MLVRRSLQLPRVCSAAFHYSKNADGECLQRIPIRHFQLPDTRFHIVPSLLGDVNCSVNPCGCCHIAVSVFILWSRFLALLVFYCNNCRDVQKCPWNASVIKVILLTLPDSWESPTTGFGKLSHLSLPRFPYFRWLSVSHVCKKKARRRQESQGLNPQATTWVLAWILVF